MRAFLTERPRIAELLAEAITVIPRYFGPEPVVALRVRDHLDPGERLYIAAYIRTTLGPKKNLDTLHQLKEDWWLEASEGLREEILLSIDPVRA